MNKDDTSTILHGLRDRPNGMSKQTNERMNERTLIPKSVYINVSFERFALSYRAKRSSFNIFAIHIAQMRELR